MHFLREGQFSVGSTFLDEALDNPPQPLPTPGTPNPSASEAEDFTSLNVEELQAKFANMYEILQELKSRNLHRAIEWARINSQELEKRGSNLEYELNQLQFIWLFQGPQVNGLPDDANNGVGGALKYARENFGNFQGRFQRHIQQLATGMAFKSNLRDSPYQRIFNTDTVWDDVSPLYTAATAGVIALPTLIKLASIVKEKRTEWTTQNELPVEIPLPRSMIFHPIFVCPVSKEQTTEENPPMMMPCGHVIAKESLNRLGLRVGRFKCPYCPNESQPKDARDLIM
jgi:hypothetical protein